MIDIKETYDLLSKVGIFPTILVVGGWIYFAILVIIFLYNLVFGNRGNPSYKDKKS